MEKYLTDYTQIFRAKGWPDQAIAAKKLNIQGRFSREIYQQNQDMLSVATIRAKLETTDSQVWETKFYERLLHDEHELTTTQDYVQHVKQEEDTEEFADSQDCRVLTGNIYGNDKTKYRVKFTHGLQFYIDEEKDWYYKRRLQ